MAQIFDWIRNFTRLLFSTVAVLSAVVVSLQYLHSDGLAAANSPYLPAQESNPLAAVVTSTVASAGQWSQLGHDPQRTSYIPVDVSGSWRLKWIWNGPINSGDDGPGSDHLDLPKGVQPVAGDGRLYVGHDDGTVRAISETTGKQVWVTALGGQVLNAGAYDAETNSVYFGATDGRFYRLDAATGNTQVSNRPGGEIVMAPLLVGDTVYVGSTNGLLYAFDKVSLAQRWSYNAGAALLASPAYSANYEGQVIILSEDKYVHAVGAGDGSRRWRVLVNADEDPRRGDTSFADTYPVVSDANDVVIVRSYLLWEKMWQPDGGAPSTVAQIRSYLTANPDLQTFFVLELADGSPRFVAPVLGGASGNGGDFESTPPQAVVKKLADGTEVAYLLWRTRQACVIDSCDGREDTTLGEMDLTTGNIRFVQDHKNQGTMRLPTDEQSPLSMAGDTLFYAHWMTMGVVRITDRASELGGSYNNPIRTEEMTPTINTLDSSLCSSRDSTNHYCPEAMYAPGDSYRTNPGFYLYYYNQRVYDMFWTTPIRSVIVNNGTIYWKTVDGAIIALEAEAAAPVASKTSSLPYARLNNDLAFFITVPATGQPITVSDALPGQFTYLASNASCDGQLTYNSSMHRVTFSGSPPSGSECVITIAVRVNTGTPVAVKNTALISSGLAPPQSVSVTIILNPWPFYLPVILKSV